MLLSMDFSSGVGNYNQRNTISAINIFLYILHVKKCIKYCYQICKIIVNYKKMKNSSDKKSICIVVI